MSSQGRDQLDKAVFWAESGPQDSKQKTSPK